MAVAGERACGCAAALEDGAGGVIGGDGGGFAVGTVKGVAAGIGDDGQDFPAWGVVGVAAAPVGDDASVFTIPAVVGVSAAPVAGEGGGLAVWGVEDGVAGAIGSDADGLPWRNNVGDGGDLGGGEGIGSFDSGDKENGKDGEEDFHSMNTLPPKAEKGKSVRAAWNGLVRWAAAAQILPGPDVRLARTTKGTVISFVPPKQVFAGAFFLSPGAGSVGFAFGMVEGMEARIEGRLVSDPEARLKVSAAKFNKEGRSWFGVLIQHKDGKIDKKAKDALRMVQRDSPAPGGKAGEHFHAVAMVRDVKERGSGETRRFWEQIEYFHLRTAWNAARKRLFVFPAL